MLSVCATHLDSEEDIGRRGERRAPLWPVCSGDGDKMLKVLVLQHVEIHQHLQISLEPDTLQSEHIVNIPICYVQEAVAHPRTLVTVCHVERRQVLIYRSEWVGGRVSVFVGGKAIVMQTF